MRQHWSCDDCGERGIVDIGDHEDVFSAIYKIDDAHRIVSPTCKNAVEVCGYRKLRVVNQYAATDAELAEKLRKGIKKIEDARAEAGEGAALFDTFQLFDGVADVREVADVLEARAKR